jgi:hypothetical protein
MSGTETYEIPPEGKELLKEIEKELPRTKLRDQDTSRNQEYEPNQMLDAKVMPLLVDLQLSVRVDTTALTLQPLNSSSI